MKRFMAILFAFAVFSVTAAQAQIIHVKSTTITTTKTKKEKPKRERLVLPPQRSGFQSDVRIGVMSLGYHEQTTFEATYTGGYRFGNTLYIGAGLGVNYNTWSGQYIEWEGGYMRRIGLDTFRRIQEQRARYGIPPAEITVPLFAQIRVYFLKSRISPFVDATGGVMLTSRGKVEYGPHRHRTAKYGRSMGYGTLSLGVNYRMTDKSSVYLLVGGRIYGARVMQADEPFYIYDYSMPSSLNIGTRTSGGFYVAIGFTF